jgi:hypothetical protein
MDYRIAALTPESRPLFAADHLPLRRPRSSATAPGPCSSATAFVHERPIGKGRFVVRLEIPPGGSVTDGGRSVP